MKNERFPLIRRTLFLLLLISMRCLAEQAEAIVLLANGDEISGELISLENQKISLKPQEDPFPKTYDFREISSIEFPHSASPENPDLPSHQAVLDMTNGDLLRGSLSGLSDSEIRLSSPSRTELDVAMRNIVSLKIEKLSSVIYRGPNHFTEWTQGVEDVGSWTFSSGELRANSPGRIAQKLPALPESCTFRFDARWQGVLNLKIQFFTEDITSPSPQSGYEMYFQGSSVHLKKCASEQWLGHFSGAGIFQEIEEGRIEIKINAKTQKIALYLNEEILHLWEDPEWKQPRGSGLHLVTENSTPLHFRRIEVSEWDGILDPLPWKPEEDFQALLNEKENAAMPPSAKVSTAPPGSIILKNGDHLEGSIDKVENEEITLLSPLGKIEIPLSRFQEIALPKDGLETPKLYQNDARASFHNGSQIVFRLDGMQNGNLLGFSQNFGHAQFSIKEIKKLEMNLYGKK